jgi:predicted nucleic acid-binding protein
MYLLDTNICIYLIKKKSQELLRRLEALHPDEVGMSSVTLIAAHALALGAVLVTNNVRGFSRVAGLGVENWTRRGT